MRNEKRTYERIHSVHRETIASIASGAVGGALGTALLQKGMEHVDKLPEAIQPPPMQDDPGEHMLERFEQARGKPLSQASHQRAAEGLHWAYGIGWGAALGAAAPRLGMSRLGTTVAAGAALGACVWAVGYAGWLPRTGLTPPLREQGLGPSTTTLGSHLVYGVLTALPIFLVRRLLDR